MGLRMLWALVLSTRLLGQTPLDQAWQLAAAGRREDAIRTLQILVAAQPLNADARLLLGSLLMEADQQKGSLEQLALAVRLRPKSPEAENALGEAYSKFGDPADAQAAFEKAVALKPDYGIAQLNLGQVLLAQGSQDTAAAHLDRAIRFLGKADDAADALYLRAKVDMAQALTEEAAAKLERAVAIRPNFAEAWSDLGQARKMLLDDAGALTAFQRAVETNPQDAVARYRLGSEYLSQNNAHRAVEYLRKAWELNPRDQSTLNSLQIALRKDGKDDEANAVKQQLTALLRDKDRVNQDHLTAIRLNNDGARLEKAGDLHGALAKYSEAATLYPEHAGIGVNYGVALLRTGQWTAGLNELHTALSRDPKNAQIQAVLKDALAQAPPDTVPKWQDARP